MSAIYPLAPPPSPGFARVRHRHGVAAAVSRSPTVLASKVYKHPGEILAFEIDLPPMDMDDARDWIAWKLALRGPWGSFPLSPPYAAVPRGSWAGAPVVDLSNQQGDTLNIKGLTPSAALIARRGDYIQLGSGSLARLHMVLLDADADSSGKAALTLFPVLREAPGDGDTLVTLNAQGVFEMVGNEIAWTEEELEVGVSFTCVESL